MISFCCFGMMTVGPELLTLYVGEEYLYLIPWFNLWLLCTLGTHNQAISSLILAGSDIRAISYSSIVGSVVGLLTAWFLIPYYEIGGVCIAFAIYCIIQLLFYYFYYWPRKMAINSWKVFYLYFAPTVIVGMCLYCLVSYVGSFGNTAIDLIVKGLSFCVLFVIVIWFMLGNKDRLFLIESVKRINKS